MVLCPVAALKLRRKILDEGNEMMAVNLEAEFWGKCVEGRPRSCCHCYQVEVCGCSTLTEILMILVLEFVRFVILLILNGISILIQQILHFSSLQPGKGAC